MGLGKIIDKNQRTLEYLKITVQHILKALKETERELISYLKI